MKMLPDWMSPHIRASLQLGALCLALAGCGGGNGLDLARVTGTVTLDGKPLPDARVEFQPQIEKGSPSYAKTDAEGRFRLHFNGENDGALIATHVVRISTFGTPDDDSDTPVKFIPERVPRKYNNESVIKVEVKQGNDPFQFDLVSEPVRVNRKVTSR